MNRAVAIVCLWLVFAFVRPVVSAGEEFLLYSRPGVGVLLRTDDSEDRVVFNQGPHVAPRLSPDRKRVLYTSLEVLASAGRAQSAIPMGVWVADCNGARKERICDGAQGTWSPDGTKILLQREGRLIERDLVSGQETAVSPDGAPAMVFPSYLPDGSIVCTGDAGKRLYLIAPGEERRPELVLDGEFRSAPRCSPDGKTLAYQDGAHIYLMDLATRTTRQLTLGPGVQAWPVWAEDGQSLCYAQTPFAFAERWDIYRVEIDSPQGARRVERNVHAAFDWQGVDPGPGRESTVPGADIKLWRGKKPLGSRTHFDLHSQEDWEVVPEGRAPGPVDGAVAIENDWLILHISCNGIDIIPKVEGDIPGPIALRVVDAQGPATADVAGIDLLQNSGEEVVAEVSFAVEKERTVKAAIRVPRTRPFVEVRPVQGVSGVVLQADAAVVVVPDRFSNDLVIDPRLAPPGATLALPETPVVLACLAQTGAMAVIVAPSDGQSMAVTNGKKGERLAEVAASLAGERVVIALLTGERMWQRPELAKSRGKWRAGWNKPFHAEWRLAARGAHAACSRTWNQYDLGLLGREPLPIEGAFAEAPEASIVYAWGRGALTPPDVLTLADVLVDVLGIERYAAAFDVEGIRGYRSGCGRAPFRELATCEPDWEPWLAFDEERELGVLEVMAAAFPVGTDATRSLLTNLGNDAIDLLRGLDNRIGEYEDFLADLAAFCHAHANGRGQGFFASVAEQANSVRGSVRGAPKTNLAGIEEALQDLLGILGTRDVLRLGDMKALAEILKDDWKMKIFRERITIPGAKEGRLWHDDIFYYEIGYEEEFRRFSHRCRRRLAEQQRILSKYRELVKHVRDEAARLIVAAPEFKALGEGIREMTRAILRDRYYLEGDWRGETPLPKGRLK